MGLLIEITDVKIFFHIIESLFDLHILQKYKYKIYVYYFSVNNSLGISKKLVFLFLKRLSLHSIKNT